MNYEAELPEIIKFGPGVRRQLPSLLPRDGAVMVVCGRHSRPRIETELLPELAGRRVILFDAVPAELPLDTIARILAAARDAGVTAFVGWGGGSAIDAAKAAAALLGTDPTKIADCFYGRCTPPARSAFFAALPTTAGTGAEMTANAVLHDRETGVKQSIRAPGMTADAALVDPELLRGAPPAVTAASGFDALTQAIESYLSVKADSRTRMTALAAVPLLFRNLEAACRDEVPALEAMAMGSMLTGMAFARSGLGAAHGIGHPVGSLLHMPHGAVCAVLLTASLRRCLECSASELSEIAAVLGLPSPEALIDELAGVRRRVGLPAHFTGLKPEHYPFILRNCRSGSMKCNPRQLSDDEVIEILKELSHE